MRLTLIRWAVVVALSVALMPVERASAALKGTVCSKAGVMKVQSGSKYLCKKTRSGLRWSVVLTRTLSPTKAPAVLPVVDPYARYGVMANVYKLMDGESERLSRSNESLNLNYVSEDAAHYRSEEALAGIRTSGRMYSQFLSDKVQLSVLLFKTDDWYLGEFSLLKSSTCTELGDGPLLWRAAGACETVVAVDLDHLKGQREGAMAFEVAHEIYHLIQRQTVGAPLEQKLPTWFVEGTGNVLGRIVWTRINPKPLTYAETLWGNQPWRLNDCNAALALWRTNNNLAGHSQTNECEYGAGTIMSELLAEKAGSVDVYIQIMRSVNRGETFEEALMGSIGLSLQSFMDASIERIKLLESQNS